MAGKNGSKNGRKGKQTYIEGMEPEVNKAVEEAAENYVEARDARMAANEDEKEKHNTLLMHMDKAGITTYKRGELTVTIDATRKAKVKKEVASDDDD